MDSSNLDSLGRFHRALVEEILQARPMYLSEPFTVSEIYQNLVPYRTHRDRIGVQMNGDYEDVLLRLLAGEGEYLILESEHALHEIAEELKSKNPNTGLYREYAAADVRLNPLRMPRDLPDPVVEGATVPAAPVPSRASPLEPLETNRPPLDPAGSDETIASAAAGGEDEAPSRCLWCREPLPRRDMLNYCPFCGADLHKVPCPNCGEELEVGWRFCVACGTGVGDPA